MQRDQVRAWTMDTFKNYTAPGNYGTQMETVFLIFNCTVLSLALVVGLPGNLWVCWVVFRTKSLQTCNNALLVSLAVSDLLKCSVDTPLLLYSTLSFGKAVHVSVCTLQQFTYALCSCVQLLTLVSISVERFQAIAFPFQTERRRARVRLWIMSIWVCGVFLALLSLSLSKTPLLYLLCRPHFTQRGDLLRDPDPFGPYVLVPVWILSLTVIIIHYMRIFKVVRQHGKKVFHRGVQLGPTVAPHSWGWFNGPGQVPGPGPPRSFNRLPAVDSGSPLPPRRLVLMVEEEVGPGGVGPQRVPDIVGAVCLLTPGARERGKKRVEGKLAQRFGYIIVAFTLFWVPMVVLLLLNVSSWQDADRLLIELETSAVVLTCVQAAVDPLLYTFVTKQFRSELSKFLSSVPGCPCNLKSLDNTS